MLHLLPGFYSKVLIPPAVVKELAHGISAGIDLPDVASLPRVIVQRPLTIANGLDRLGAGEREVISLGTEMRDAVILMDDLVARMQAGDRRLKFTGTLGLLLRAKIQGSIDQVQPFVERLQQLGFRLAPRTRVAVLRAAEELIE